MNTSVLTCLKSSVFACPPSQNGNSASSGSGLHKSRLRRGRDRRRQLIAQGLVLDDIGRFHDPMIAGEGEGVVGVVDVARGRRGRDPEIR
jgi:hypothetical protein